MHLQAWLLSCYGCPGVSSGHPSRCFGCLWFLIQLPIHWLGSSQPGSSEQDRASPLIGQPALLEHYRVLTAWRAPLSHSCSHCQWMPCAWGNGAWQGDGHLSWCMNGIHSLNGVCVLYEIRQHQMASLSKGLVPVGWCTPTIQWPPCTPIGWPSGLHLALSALHLSALVMARVTPPHCACPMGFVKLAHSCSSCAVVPQVSQPWGSWVYSSMSCVPHRVCKTHTQTVMAYMGVTLHSLWSEDRSWEGQPDTTPSVSHLGVKVCKTCALIWGQPDVLRCLSGW